MSSFKADFESKDPKFKGYAKIDTIGCALLINGSGSQFNNFKDNDIYGTDIHSLEYFTLSSEFTLHASAREITTQQSYQILPEPIHNIAMSAQTEVNPTTTACVQCQKQFPRTVRIGADSKDAIWE